MAHLIAYFMELKGEDTVSEGEELLELVEVTNEGIVEIAFDVAPKAERVYIKFELAELVRLALLAERSEVE